MKVCWRVVLEKGYGLMVKEVSVQSLLDVRLAPVVERGAVSDELLMFLEGMKVLCDL